MITAGFLSAALFTSVHVHNLEALVDHLAAGSESGIGERDDMGLYAIRTARYMLWYPVRDNSYTPHTKPISLDTLGCVLWMRYPDSLVALRVLGRY